LRFFSVRDRGRLRLAAYVVLAGRFAAASPAHHRDHPTQILNMTA